MATLFYVHRAFSVTWILTSEVELIDAGAKGPASKAIICLCYKNVSFSLNEVKPSRFTLSSTQFFGISILNFFSIILNIIYSKYNN